MEFTQFLPISKIDIERRMVWGYASTPTKDLQGEIVTLDAIKGALPDYMQWANIRQMHSTDLAVAGVTQEANVDENGLYIGAKIVDNDAWTKCVEKVYKGFSIGGNKLKKVGNEVQKLHMLEISLVDRPANPDCRIDVVKAAGAELVAEEGEGLASALAKVLDLGKALVAKMTGPPAARDGFSLPVQTEKTAAEDVEDKVKHTPPEHQAKAKTLFEIHKTDEQNEDNENAAEEDDELSEAAKEKNMDPKELQKRYSAMHKGALTKAAGHLRKAMSIHGKAMNECAKCMSKAAKMAKAAGDEETAGALGKVHSLLSEMGDQHELALHNLNRAGTSGDVSEDSGKLGAKDGTSEEVSEANKEAIKETSMEEMTEGEVETTGMFATNSPYSAAAIASLVKAAVTEATSGLKDEMHKVQVENARMTGAMDVLKNAPSGRKGPMLWSGDTINKAVGTGDSKDEINNEIIKAAQSVDPNDPDSGIRGAARIIGLRAMNPTHFGHKLTDPSFKGGAGAGK